MKQIQYEKRQRFSLRKYAIGTCSVLIGASLFFVGLGSQPVAAAEANIKEISNHYVDEQDLSHMLKTELQWFEENKVQIKEGKEYYFVYRKLANKLPETGSLSNDGMLFLGASFLLVSLTLIKKKKKTAYFLVTVFALGAGGASIQALEHIIELQAAQIKRVEGNFLPSPEKIQGYEFTGYYFEREATKVYSSHALASPVFDQDDQNAEAPSRDSKPDLGIPLVPPTNHGGLAGDAGLALVPPTVQEVPTGDTGAQASQAQAQETPAADTGAQPSQPPVQETPVADTGIQPSQPPVQETPAADTGAQPSQPPVQEIPSGDTGVQPSQPPVQEAPAGDTGVPATPPTNQSTPTGDTGAQAISPSNEGQVGQALVQPEPPAFEGGVAGEPEIQEDLPVYQEVTPLPQPRVETRRLAYETIYQANDSLERGLSRVIVQGQEGQEQVTTTYSLDPTSGSMSQNRTVNVLANKVDQLVEVGTKPTVERTPLPAKTIYQADSSLAFGQKELAQAGHDGELVTTTSYQVDGMTGQVTADSPSRQVTPSLDRVMKVGNLERVIQAIPIAEERRNDPSLAKNTEKIEFAGQAGEETVIRSYAVNEATGDLLNPQESRQITKQMRPRVILVGTQEDRPHLLPANPSLENAVDVSALAESLKSLDFLNSPAIQAQLEPHYDPRDIALRKILLKKTRPNISDQEVKDLLRPEYLQKLSLQEAFDQTKAQAEASFKKIAAHTLSILGDTSENRRKVKQDLEDNKEQILLGLAYIQRFYNIQFGDTNIRDILAYNPSSFTNKKVTALDSLKKLGSMSYEEMKLTNSPQTYKKYLADLTGKASLKEFFDSNRQLFTSDDAETWLKKASKAMIVATPSKENPAAPVGLYRKLTEGEPDPRKQDANMAAILGLLNLTEPSVYVISNMATISYGNIGTYLDASLAQSNPSQYKVEVARVKALIDKAAQQQANYVDTLYRITKPENRDKLVSNRLIIDTMKQYSSRQDAQIETTWSPAFGSSADKGVAQFMTPMNYYSPVSKVGAEANGLGVRYFIDRVLDDRGSATYSHEMTHLLDRTVLFNNQGRRDGTGAEFYARGMFENSYTPESDTYLNLNFVYDHSDKDGFYNKKPDRFQSPEDLKTYMQRSFDVLYTLDYLEAEASKDMSSQDKIKYFKKIIPVGTRGSRTWVDYRNAAVKPSHMSEEIQALSLEEANQLSNIDSLIDHHILVNRYIIAGFRDRGLIEANGYYTIDMFDTIYGVSQNDSGMSGDISFRKQAFELMAALGYYEGFVPYVSNQYKQAAEAEGQPLSDTYIFSKILKGKTYADFKKDQIKGRVAKLGQLKPVTIQYEGQEIALTSQKVSDLMKKAVQQELEQIKAGHTKALKYDFIESPVQKLKKAIYKAYLKATDDFSSSIYK